MVNKKIYHVVVIVAITFFITLLHLWILNKLSPHIILEELYYIPILLGALLLGLKGAILTYVFVSVSYIPFFFGLWTVTPLGVANRLLHLLFSGLLAFLAGFLVDRAKRQQKELEKDRHLARIGQVAATIVHDLKNPLMVIQGFSRRILKGKGNVKIAAEAISDSAQTMQNIVNDVLDFSRPADMELKETDIGAIIRQASELCKMKAEAKGVLLALDIPGKPINIAVADFQIQRALVNLISNAIESSDDGQKVSINLTMRKHHLLVKIKDNGSGMDDETIENIFVPFYSRKSGGTGLGMPITKKIIDAHKGKIYINSKPQAGTEVIIELPLGLGVQFNQ